MSNPPATIQTRLDAHWCGFLNWLTAGFGGKLSIDDQTEIAYKAAEFSVTPAAEVQHTRQDDEFRNWLVDNNQNGAATEQEIREAAKSIYAPPPALHDTNFIEPTEADKQKAIEWAKSPEGRQVLADAKAMPALPDTLAELPGEPGWYEFQRWDDEPCFKSAGWWDGRELRHGPEDQVFAGWKYYKDFRGPLVVATDADSLRLQVASLFDAVAHGDDEHRDWLQKAIDDHFAGRPIDTVSGKGEREILKAQIITLTNELKTAMEERDKQWLEAIHPGNLNTLLGQTYNTPEKYREFSHARLCNEQETMAFQGKVVDAMYAICEAVTGDRDSWIGEDDEMEALPALVEKIKLLTASEARVKELTEGERLECEAGCRPFTGGELRHHPDCKHYPDSLSKMLDDAEASILALTAENEQLKIRLLSAAGDDLCRLSQEEIKAYTSGEVQIPPKEEFIASCERFHEQIAAGPGVLNNCLTLAQLIAENQRLTSLVAERPKLIVGDDVQESGHLYAWRHKDASGAFIGDAAMFLIDGYEYLDFGIPQFSDR